MGSSKKHKDKDRDRDNKHKSSRYRSRSRSPRKSKSRSPRRERDYDRNRDYERNRERDYDRDYERNRERDYDRDSYEGEYDGRRDKSDYWDRDDDRRDRKERDRGKYDDKRSREDDDYQVPKKKFKQEKEDSPIEVRGADQGGEISLSIAETNKLRAKLGLRLLEVPKDDGSSTKKEKKGDEDEDVHAPPVNLAQIKKTELLAEKLAEIKRKREINKKLGKVKTLGESDDEGDSATAWIKKTRKIEKDKIRADRRAKELESMEKEFGLDGLVESSFVKKPSYSSRDLTGIQVQHDQGAFVEGKSVILTLKDKGVLDDDNDDVLVNVNMLDDEAVKKNNERKKLKPGYNPYDNDEFDEDGMLKMKNILEKYDEEDNKPKQNFQIGKGGVYDAEEEKHYQRIKEDLRVRSQTLELPSLNIANDFMTPEEMQVKFKKIKKKSTRKIREKKKMLKPDDLLPLAGEYDTGLHHGSRSGVRKRLGGNEETNGGVVDMDVDPSQEEPDEVGPEEDLSHIVVEVDEAHLELQLALNKTRKLKMKKESAIPEKIAEKIISEKLDELENEDAEKDLNIVLNQTSEFCRTLGDIPTYGLSGNRDEERDELLDKELEILQKRRRELEEEENRTGWEQVEISDQPVNIETEETAVLDEEPLMAGGVAGALELASKKGYLENDGKVRNSAPKHAHLMAKNYSIEDKRYDDLDEKYRRSARGDRFSSGPLVEFREKSGYTPDFHLEHVDETGRLLNEKEAFKQLSYRFHGKGSGKKKTEKRMKKLEEERLMKMMSSSDTPLNTLQMLQEKQRSEQTPYIVISGGSRSGAATLSK